MPKVAIVLLYTAAALAMIGLIKLLMYFESPASATRPSLQQPIPSELLKVLVLHGQWLFILANLIGIPWPATLMYPLQVRELGYCPAEFFMIGTPWGLQWYNAA
jgi:hypothetical protein